MLIFLFSFQVIISGSPDKIRDELTAYEQFTIRMDWSMGSMCSKFTDHLRGDAVVTFNELPLCQWLGKIQEPHATQFRKPIVSAWINGSPKITFPVKWRKLKTAMIQQTRATIPRAIKRRAIRKVRKRDKQRLIYDAKKHILNEKIKNKLMKEF